MALQCIVVSSETSFGSGQRQTTRDAALLQLQTRIIQEKQLQLQLPSSHQGRLDGPTFGGDSTNAANDKMSLKCGGHLSK